MRKTIILFIISLGALFLSSCNKSEEFADFSAAFKDYKYSSTTGHRYLKTQRFNDVVVYEQRFEQKVNNTKDKQAHIYSYLRELTEFNLESQYSEAINNLYYYKDSVGTVSGQEIVWEEKAFSEVINEPKLPNFKFKKEYFTEHSITKLADYLLLKADLKNEYTKDFFQIEEGISDVYIEVRIRNKKLQEFKIFYTLDKTIVETSFRVYYDNHELDVTYE